ncbi:MAG: lipopolysaccharide kinase InaA family protein [bacterium]
MPQGDQQEGPWGLIVPQKNQDSYERIEREGLRCLVDKSLDRQGVESGLTDPDGWFTANGARLIKKSPNWLAEVPMAGAESGPAVAVILKKYIPVGILGKLRHGAGPSKAFKAWNRAFDLLGHKIKTPRPLLFLERIGPDGKTRAASYLGVEQVSGAKQLREVLAEFRRYEKTEGQAHASKYAFLGHLARFVRQLHEADFCHRDLSGGNILIGGPYTSPEFFLLDINRGFFSKPLTFAQRLRDLERVYIDAKDHEFFYRAYCTSPEQFETEFMEFCSRNRRYRQFRQTRDPIRKFYLRMRVRIGT